MPVIYIGKGDKRRLVRIKRNDIQRFYTYLEWDDTNKDACWKWLGSKTREGYGEFCIWDGIRTSKFMAHRISYVIFNGQVFSNLDVKHSCNNRECCNPLHLNLGTHKQNMTERMILYKRVQYLESLLRLNNISF